VGYGGSQLSGGQKQRIAIARAILRKPQILILDEATSALDRRNEKLIQATLDKLVTGSLTTLTIAHRIKTVMNASTIFVLSSGKVIESGKFRELERFKGVEVEAEQLKPEAVIAEGPSEYKSKSASEAAMLVTKLR
jgi:ATP-binding cassette, subfamily B (MDR/TAP), member 1